MATTIINASAGSGKTYRLAVAYLQALLQKLPDGTPTQPQQVLATTFTRAAASEILERVLRRLAQAVVSDEERSRLLAEINHPELGRDELAALLSSVCQALPQLQVGTIDALFARMVRVMGLDLAFPPAWTVADETQADELAHEAADRILRGPDVQLSLGQWRRYAQFKPGIRVRAALVELLENNRFMLIDAQVAEDDPDLAEPLKLTRAETTHFSQMLHAFDGIPRTKAGQPNANWVKDMERTKLMFAGEGTLISLLSNKLLRCSGQEGATHRGIEIPLGLRNLLGPLVKRACDDLRRLHEARLPALVALARSYHEFRRMVAYAGAAYRFPEVEAAATKSLPSHLSEDDLYFRLDGQVQHLLLDEFQDTSLSQFRFLWPIIEEIRSYNRLFFAVGDVKQSIYGWRGADRHLLNLLPEWLDPKHQDKNLKLETLDNSRRSSRAVLKAINRLFLRLDHFACLDPEIYKDAAEKDRVKVRRRAAASFISDYREHLPIGDNQYLAGRVRLLITQDPRAEVEEDAEEVPGEVETILGAVEQHRREDMNREIAILCRRRKLIPSIIAGLRLRGIEASGEGGSPVADSAAVELILSMLTWIDHPGHSLAKGHVELSGMVEVFGLTGSPQQDQFLPKKMQTEIMRRGLAVVMTDWVRHDLFRQRCTVHDQVRCEQLVELARHWEIAGGGRLTHFVERVRSQRLDNPISSRVRVMTIHGSKGLEFDAVILADLQSSGGAPNGPQFVVTTTAPNKIPEIHLLPGKDEAELLGLQDIYERHQQNQFEEDLSVLYVALTRAKSFLDVVVPASEKAKASLVGILSEGWGHHDAGTHLIEQCEEITRPNVSANKNVMGRDAGIWETGGDLRIPHFQPVPNRLAAVTPSGREGAGIMKLAQVLNIGNGPALERGTAVHALLSRIEWNDNLPSLNDWIDSIPSREADREACRVAAKELHPRLRDSRDNLAGVFDSARWLDRWKKEGVVRLEVWRERRFAAVFDGELMNGSFDRVVFGLNAQGARVRTQVLDFKTDRIVNDAEREERRKHYQPQLDAYVGALHKLLALPLDSIQAELVWINR